jgi:hypothetical protein
MSLFADPVSWSGSMVKSWWRYWLFSAFLTIAIAYAVYESATDGWKAAGGIVIYLGGMQFFMLYAPRRLYLKLTEEDRISGAA